MTVRHYRVCALLLLLLLPSCIPYDPTFGRNSPRAPQAPQPVPPPETSGAEPSVQTVPSSPETSAPRVIPTVPRPAGAAAFLLAEAQSYRTQGNYVAAAASIERAMRIEPGNPWLSLELANIRLDQLDIEQGESLARRALSKSASDANLKSTIWLTISRARELANDPEGARSALQKSQAYAVEARG